MSINSRPFKFKHYMYFDFKNVKLKHKQKHINDMVKIQGCKNEKLDKNLRNEYTMDFYEPISHMCISIYLVKFT